MPLRPFEIPHIDFAIANFRPNAFDFANTHFAPRSLSQSPQARPPADIERQLEVALAERYATTREHVGVFSGCTGALFSAALTCAGGVAVETPGFEPTRRLWQAAGRTTHTFDRAAPTADLVAALPPDTKLVCWTSPLNPHGHLSTRADLAGLADRLAERGMSLLVNEIYLDYLGPPTGVSAFGLRPNIFVASSLTKAWGRGDLRIGWLVGPPQNIAAARTSRFVSTGPLPRAPLGEALDEIQRAEEILGEVREETARRRAQLESTIQRHAGFSVSSQLGVSEGASLPYLLMALPPGLSGVEFARRANSRGILVAPGEFLDAPGHVRVSVSALEQFEPARAVFEEFLAGLSQH